MEGEDELDLEVEEWEYDENELKQMDEEQLAAFLEELSTQPHNPVDHSTVKPAQNSTELEVRRLADRLAVKPKAF